MRTHFWRNILGLLVATLVAGCGTDLTLLDAPPTGARPATAAIATTNPSSAPTTREPATDRLVCAASETASVSYIFDGDTVAVRYPDGQEDTVRYIGIDTPEVGEVCAEAATIHQRALAAGKQVFMLRDVSDRDIYGRLLRYVCTEDGVFINAEMVAAGLALAKRYPPDTQYANTFKTLENEAALAGRGCLHADAVGNTASDGSLCCKICRTSKACGDTCIPVERSCNATSGCACDG
ncbi:MAG: thermonuclease family protein [Thiotrichales bacterium]